jgi:hypothetical protein
VQERAGDPPQAAVVAGHERFERRLVTGAQTVEKHLVVVHRVVKLSLASHTGYARGCNTRAPPATHRGMTPLHPQFVRDDRVLPATRWAALIVFFILVPATAILWVAPDRTGDLWAWMIQPELTPIFLGSGYGAGAYFFWRTYRAERWHPSSPGVLGASVFAALMLIATGIHWDRFNDGDAPALAAIAFYAWTIVYVISPFAVFALWWRNRATDPRTPSADDPRVPPVALLAARAFAASALATGVLFFAVPAIAIDIWPWQLTPLTARVLASLTVQVGVGALVLARDPRWSAWRLIVHTYFVAAALQLIGAIRAFGDFDIGNPLTWLYLGGLLGTAGALALLHHRMEAPVGDSHHPTTPAPGHVGA